MRHDDLIAQAKHLAALDPAAPKQANLCRAVSAAYYSVFHFFLHEAAEHFMAGVPSTADCRMILARAFTHGSMRAACECFANGKVPKHVAPPGAAPAGAPPITGPPPPAATDREVKIPAYGEIDVHENIVTMAKLFTELQQARKRADYDVSEPFRDKVEVDPIIAKAESIMATWGSFRHTPTAYSFLIVLLAHTNLQRHGAAGE